MAHFRRHFSIGILLLCILLLALSVGLTIVEYFDLFTNNIFNPTNNIASWPGKMNWYPLTKLIWNEKTSQVGELFFLFIVPLFLFWGILNLLAALLESILSLIALIIILILIILSFVFSLLVAFLASPILLVLAIFITVRLFSNNYSIANKIVGVSVSILNLTSAIMFFIFAFSH